MPRLVDAPARAGARGHTADMEPSACSASAVPQQARPSRACWHEAPEGHPPRNYPQVKPSTPVPDGVPLALECGLIGQLRIELPLLRILSRPVRVVVEDVTLVLRIERQASDDSQVLDELAADKVAAVLAAMSAAGARRRRRRLVLLLRRRRRPRRAAADARKDGDARPAQRRVRSLARPRARAAAAARRAEGPRHVVPPAVAALGRRRRRCRRRRRRRPRRGWPRSHLSLRPARAQPPRLLASTSSHSSRAATASGDDARAPSTTRPPVYTYHVAPLRYASRGDEDGHWSTTTVTISFKCAPRARL